MIRPILVSTLALLILATGAQAQNTTTFRMEPVPGLVVDHGLPGYLDVLPDGERTHLVTLRNEGNETLQLRVATSEAAPSMETVGLLQASATPHELTLAANESATLTLVVKANASAKNDTRSAVSLWISWIGKEPRTYASVPVLIGPPCEECRPASSSGQVSYTRTAGGNGPPPGVTVMETQYPANPARNATAGQKETTNAIADDDSDPYKEVPGPSAILSILSAALVAFARRVRPFRLRLRRNRWATPLMLVAMLLPATTVHAAAEVKVFSLTRIGREDGNVTLTLNTTYAAPTRVSIALLSPSGALLGPERTVSHWWDNEGRTFTFAAGRETTATLRIQYEWESKLREERIELALPAANAARIDVLDLDRVTTSQLRLTLINVGEHPSQTILARLEEPTGARISEPAMRRLDGLAAGDTAVVTFGLHTNASEVVLIVDHGGRTERIHLRLPPAPAEGIELVRAIRDENGEAAFTIRTSGGREISDVRLRVARLDGTLVGEPSLYLVGVLRPDAVATARFRIPDGLYDVRLLVETSESNLSIPVRVANATTESSGSLRLETDLPARETAPGSTASYGLKVSNTGGSDATITLQGLGLPPGYEVTFNVGASAARTLVVPAGATRDVAVNVRVPDGGGRDAGAQLPLRILAESDKGASAALDLQLTVRGAARLDVQAQNWFLAGARGEERTIALTIRNLGSGPARDVTPGATVPTGWSVRFEPPTIAVLEAGASREVTMRLTLPSDAGEGRYGVDVSAASGELVARPRNLVVELAAEEPSRLPWLAGAGVAGLAAVGLIVKLRRR